MRRSAVITPRLWRFASWVMPLAIGCGDGGESGDGILAPPPDGQGIQLEMTTTIAAGVEAEHCRFVQAPARDLWVNRDEIRFTTGSHHVLLYETPYRAIPTRKADGTAVDTSGVFDCSDGATNGWEVTKLIGGSQNGDGESMLAFPAGVAMRVRAGAILLINAHYVNASDVDLEPDVRINLYTLPREQVTQQGDILFLYNPLIMVPGHGTSRAHWRCPVQSDITIANVQSHMHARGVGYAATVDRSAPFYQNDRWERVPVERFEPGLVVRAGSRLDYYCDYRNDEARDVFQGPRSTDEMCMLIGSYFPADPSTANCLSASGDSYAGEWVGSGSATCAQTLTCIEDALEGDRVLEALTACVLAADPSVSAPVSSVVSCLFANDGEAAPCKAAADACRTL